MRRLVLLLLLVLPASAHAQAGQIVASAGGYDLYARHGAHGGICLSLLGPQQASGDGGCARVFSPFHPAQTFSYPSGTPIGLAVPGTVTRVTASGKDVPTVAADGYGVRFALIAGAGRHPLLRLYDAGGALVGAVDGSLGQNGFNGSGTQVFAGSGTRIVARRSFDLDPTPLQYDRTIPTTCYDIKVDAGGTGTCTRDSDLGGFAVDVTPACAPSRPLLSGLVAARVRATEVVLGDGSTRRYRTRALPANLGPGRLAAASLPRGEAVRSVRGFDRAGRVIGRKRIGAAPSGLPCPASQDSSSSYALAFSEDLLPASTPGIAPPVVVAQADGVRLGAADGPHGQLCTGLRRLSCGTPPVDAAYAHLNRHGAVVTGVFSADVAGVRITFAGDGGTLDALTTDGPAYTGRYAGHVRFLAARIPHGWKIERAVPHDADGHRIGTVYVDEETDGATSTRRRFAPGVRLVRSGSTSCLQPRHPRSPLARIGICSQPRRAFASLISVTCAPRRAVAFGVVPPGQRVTLHLTGGATLKARIRRVPGLGRAWSAVLPKDRGLTELSLTDGRSLPATVPPAAEQCGYEDVGGVF